MNFSKNKTLLTPNFHITNYICNQIIVNQNNKIKKKKY